MPRYTTVIDSAWGVEPAFTFMSDFSNARIWDPSVVAAHRLDEAAVRVGSTFDLTVAVARRTARLRYTVVAIEPPDRVVFAAATRRLQSVDTLTFEPRPGGCRMTYDATLRLKGMAAIANPLLAVGFRRLGNRARDSLQSLLTPEPTWLSSTA